VRRVQLLPSVVGDPSKFEDDLVDRGAMLPDDSHARKLLLANVAKSVASEQFVYEARGGWLEPGKTFVLPDGAISAETTNIIRISPTFDVEDPSGRRTSSGTLTSWRDTIGQTSRLGSHFMLMVSANFAAPLLAIIGHQSFSLCVYGRSRSGKTIATLLGSSMIGIGQPENLMSWNLTNTRFEERLTGFNDLSFPIDDLSTMKGTTREKYFRIRDIAYRVTQGWATGRSATFTKAHEGVHGSWRSIMLTSSEKSVREMAADAKVERQHGESLRLIDVPATVDGLDHIFDRSSMAGLTHDFSSWRDSTFANIVADCRTNHGAALRAYLEKIITAEFDIAIMVREAAAMFVQHISVSTDNVVARDVAGKFGVIYAGGLLGIRFGIVPWTQEELLDAIGKCFRGARDQLPDEGVALRQGLDTLEGRLKGLDLRRTLKERKLTSDEWDKVDGYQRQKEMQDRYIIKREVFNALFATVPQRDLVLKWLIENRRITTAVVKGGSASATAEPKKQFIWPDKQRRRSYEIVFPRA
jgi:Domain of unknown function (DUF927)